MFVEMLDIPLGKPLFHVIVERDEVVVNAKPCAAAEQEVA